MPKETITRYDKLHIVSSPLNPIEDITSWISGLNSRGYVSDILNTVHGFTSPNEIKRSAQLVALYSDNATGLIDQALAGPSQVSFLPIYYAILNLSKIYIITRNRRTDLERNQWHGAVYNRSKSSNDLLNEEIFLKSGGIFPLFYQSLTGLPWRHQNKKVRLDNIYPFIQSISFEYSQAYNKPANLQIVSLTTEENSDNRYFLAALLAESPHPNANQKRYLPFLKRFHQDPQNPNKFVSNEISAPTIDEAQSVLLRDVRRYLLYSPNILIDDYVYCTTTLSNKRLLLPEEIPIWIAFFHLSNIVRYKPEFLSKVKNSRTWPVLLTLRKHAMLRYLLLFWSYLHQTTFIITNP